MSKHILIICQFFYPEQFRINDIAFEWVKRGCKVTVVTGLPNYPEGKIYEGYGLFKKRHEIINGVEVYRIPEIPRGKTKLGMALNYYSFPFFGFFWNLTTSIKADEVFKDHKSYYIFLKELKNCCYARTYDFLKENQDDYKAVLAYIPHIFCKGHYHAYLEKYDGKVLDIAGNSLYNSIEEANTILNPDIIKKYTFEEVQKEYNENKDLFKEMQNKYYKLQTLTLMKDKIR